MPAFGSCFFKNKITHTNFNEYNIKPKCIFLINPLSGDNKGTKLIKKLTNNGYICFDLLEMTKSDDIFKKFVDEITKIYDGMEAESRKSGINNNDGKREMNEFHPRIVCTCLWLCGLDILFCE